MATMKEFFKPEELSERYVDGTGVLVRRVDPAAWARWQSKLLADAESAEVQRLRLLHVEEERWNALIRDTKARTGVARAQLAGRGALLVAKIDGSLVSAARDAYDEMMAARSFVEASQAELVAHLAKKPNATSEVTAWVRAKLELETSLPLYQEISAKAGAAYDKALMTVRVALQPHAAKLRISADAAYEDVRLRTVAMIEAADELHKFESAVAEEVLRWSVEA